MTEATEVENNPQLDRLVKAYIKIRDSKEALTKQRDAEIKELEEQLDALKGALLQHCKDHGVEGGRTTAGTFSRTIKTRYWTNDWSAMNDFIIENRVVDLLEKRLHQTNMKQFMEEHPDLVPPGLNVDSEYMVTVRRSR